MGFLQKATTTAKWFSRIFGGIIVFILLLLVLLCIPQVQTFLGKQATNILSRKMETKITIEQLRVDFNLKIVAKGIQICDQKENNLIAARYVRMNFPVFKSKYLEFNNVYVEGADVYMRTYQGEDNLNMQFFINFFKPKHPKTQKTVIKFNHLTMRNSRYHLRNDNKAGEDVPGLWNYSNMILSNINTKMKQMIIIGDSLNFFIDELSCKERSGFEIKEYNGRLELWRNGIYAHSTRFVTANGSDINIDFGFDFDNFKCFKNFEEEVRFNTELHPSQFNTADLAYFAKALQDMPNMVDVNAKVTGPLSDMYVDSAYVALTPSTRFNGKVHLKGLPDINNTMIDVNCRQLNANIKDVLAFNLPHGKKITVPAKLQQIKTVSAQGDFTGKYNNFNVNAALSTNLGDARCDARLDFSDKPWVYTGLVETQNLQLGNLLPTDIVNDITGNIRIEGKGTKIKDMNTVVNGNISSIDFKGIPIRDINIEGNVRSNVITGSLSCSDNNFDITAQGIVDFTEEDPVYKINADVNNINLSTLKLFRTDSNAQLSTHISSDISGKFLDSLYGELTLTQTTYSENGVDYSIPDINITANQYTDHKQDILLTSDILKAKIYGDFQYKNILSACKHTLHQYLPSLIAVPADTLPYQQQTLYCSVDLDEWLPVFGLFLPQIGFNEGLTLNAYLDEHQNEMLFDANIPTLQIKKMCLRDIDIKSSSDKQQLNLTTIGSGFQFKINDTVNDINNIKLTSAIQNDTINFSANASGNNINKLEDVYLEGQVGFWDAKNLFINLTNGSILWNEESYLLDTFNRITISPKLLHIDNLGIRALNDKSLQMHSQANKQNEEAILFDFNNIELGMLNLFLNRFNISLKGIATGKGGIVNTGNKQKFAVGSSIAVTDFYFNDVPLGFMNARTIWRSQVSKLYINADLFTDSTQENRLTNISGYFDPAKKYIDLDGDIRNFNIKTLEPYLKSFAYKMEGFGTGTLSFKGPVKDAKLLGEVTLHSGVMGIDFLKTEYTLHNQKINFVDTGFIFNNVTARDMYNNPVTINGMVTHQKLRNWGMNLRMRATNALALNTTLKDNNLFYGKAFVTGNINMKGQAGDIIQIDADVLTEPKTDIGLMFDWSTTANESDVISFVNYNTEKTEVLPASSETHIGVNMKIKATPNATVRVFLDPSIGGSIIGRGSGTVELNVSPEAGFRIYGVYTLSDGVFNIAYGDVLTRSFKLQNGSTISWTGDPKGTMNVKAVQSTKVSINNLVAGEDNQNSYRPVSVNNILYLQGDLLKPDFNFSFNMPDADENIKSIVYNSIDTSDREEMVKQMIAVLFLGMFEATDANTTGSTISSGLGYSISELISYQINKVVSSISENLDVRVAYRSNEDNAENEYSVDVGGNFLNNRLSIKTTFGVLDQKDIDNSDRFLGDITAEYKITKDGSLKVKAFNVTNQQDKLEYTSKYSQGIGLSFSKDFNSYKELFTPKRKRAKNKTVLPPYAPAATDSTAIVP